MRWKRDSAWEDAGIAELRQRLAQATAQAQEAEASRTFGGTTGRRLGACWTPGGPRARIVKVEAQAREAEERTRGFEDHAAEGVSSFRHRLGLSASRKLSGVAPVEVEESEQEMDLRAAVARSLRSPLRASGLTLSLQATTQSSEGKAVLRRLSSSLRRLDQLAADLHDAHRIVNGSLRLKPRRTDMEALITTTLEDATHLEDRLVRLDAKPVSAFVDPVRARQIVEAMLDAARDRTRAGAMIVVRLNEVETELVSPSRTTIGRPRGSPLR